ncbi:hypothetical protein B0I35DRAFT_496301 [Stachybotrys elegans]|uniref:Uncharacterized protein n=1 Tax=Stachybotrys elegans TaxID=80388 RepID=A0A8K0WTX5_9HYPO|nr:hypothetical protein B0I35DRAFT_496301 [Stachybotrys elegans]
MESLPGKNTSQQSNGPDQLAERYWNGLDSLGPKSGSDPSFNMYNVILDTRRMPALATRLTIFLKLNNPGHFDNCQVNNDDDDDDKDISNECEVGASCFHIYSHIMKGDVDIFYLHDDSSVPQLASIIPSTDTPGYCSSPATSCDTDGAYCTNFFRVCEFQATPSTCGEPQSYDANGCAGNTCGLSQPYDANGCGGTFDGWSNTARCRNAYAGCVCRPTLSACGAHQSCADKGENNRTASIHLSDFTQERTYWRCIFRTSGGLIIANPR